MCKTFLYFLGAWACFGLMCLLFFLAKQIPNYVSDDHTILVIFLSFPLPFIILACFFALFYCLGHMLGARISKNGYWTDRPGKDFE